MSEHSDYPEMAVFGTTVSSPDPNNFYAVLHDVRATTVSENMYDVAEKLLHCEKENAKLSLEKLWSLKNNMQDDASAGTVELLIQYYQDKINVLRSKEEHMKQISRDSRKLLEEKRIKDTEVATVKQSITDCTRDLEELSAKLEKLKIREQELTLIGTQLEKELQVNENEIVNGLYEIILSQHENMLTSGDESNAPLLTDGEVSSMKEVDVLPQGFSIEQAIADEASQNTAPEAQSPVVEENADTEADEVVARRTIELFQTEVETPEKSDLENALNPSDQIMDETASDDDKNQSEAEQVFPEAEENQPEIISYPTSVVKTRKGKIIGEYYFNPQVYKNQRHFVYSSKFFLQKLETGLGLLKRDTNNLRFKDLKQIIEDVYQRLASKSNVHVEVSTNEILNRQQIGELWKYLHGRAFEEIENFCSRLRAKIEALGTNANVLLGEQLERLHSN